MVSVEKQEQAGEQKKEQAGEQKKEQAGEQLWLVREQVVVSKEHGAEVNFP